MTLDDTHAGLLQLQASRAVVTQPGAPVRTSHARRAVVCRGRLASRIHMAHLTVLRCLPQVTTMGLSLYKSGRSYETFV